MKILKNTLRPYEHTLTNGMHRAGTIVEFVDSQSRRGWGDIAPLPKWSKETLEEATHQFHDQIEKLTTIDWNPENCSAEISKLELLPSVSFAIESAILSLIAPLGAYEVQKSALFMGSPEEILKQAQFRKNEGHVSAKLKVSHLSFKEAAALILQLKDQFFLRIDVNRAWSTEESLRFFSQFPLTTFDYVEEPFQNPKDLAQFLHPLAIDESFPSDLSLEELEALPKLKALIYKPTIQGGISSCKPLYEWTKHRGVSLVMSSSFESDIGIACVASMAHRLGLKAPVGMGTYDYLNHHLNHEIVLFSNGRARISPLSPRNYRLLELRQ